MSLQKWIGAAVVISTLVACGASGDSTTPFTSGDGDDGGGTLVDAGSTTTDSGGGGFDSGTKPPVDAGPVGDASVEAGPTGNPVGFPCTGSADCMSGLCKPVVAGAAGSVCVSACTKQADCSDNFFCDPITAGSTDGYCVPHSPAHCEVCSDNSDCGSLSEVCGVAAGDTQKACHIDCSLAPTAGTTAACPTDYTCQSTTIDGNARQICMPKSPITKCVDALGGFCDRVATDQACARIDATAGTCVGFRTCSAASNRYSTCSAASPACKMCGVSDPTGCTENLCASAARDVNNCGTCGNVCPGQGKTSDNVTCDTTAAPTCKFSCQGENYDVDNSASDGCEVPDSPAGNHATGNATYVGSYSCKDGDSQQDIKGIIPSDARVHESPAVTGFDSASGSAPDYIRIHDTGGTFCEDDIDLTVVLTGTTHPSCYTMTIQTSKGSYTCSTSGSGTTASCEISKGKGAYGDDTDLFVEISKSCTTSVEEAPSYEITGHL